METVLIARIVEAVLLASEQPLSLKRLQALLDQESEGVSKEQLIAAIDSLREVYAERAFELSEVASGYRLQVRADMAPWVSRLWEEKPPRYSRALLETLAIIAYRQPITRADIEEIRGVGVSSQIIKTMQEREWIQVVGHRDLPGRPAMFGTTRKFLDYFDLQNLDELPTLAELRDLDKLTPELAFGDADQGGESVGEASPAGDATAAEPGPETESPPAKDGEAPVETDDGLGEPSADSEAPPQQLH